MWRKFAADSKPYQNRNPCMRTDCREYVKLNDSAVRFAESIQFRCGQKRVLHEFGTNPVQFKPYKSMAHIAPQRHCM